MEKAMSQPEILWYQDKSHTGHELTIGLWTKECHGRSQIPGSIANFIGNTSPSDCKALFLNTIITYAIKQAGANKKFCPYWLTFMIL